MSEPQPNTHSLRRRLLLGILVPVIAFISQHHSHPPEPPGILHTA